MSLRYRVLIVAALVCGMAPAMAKETKAVAATVNGKPIYESQVESFVGKAPGNPNREQVLNELITQELVYQDAIAKKVEKDPEVQRALAEMRRRVLMNADVQKVVEKSPVTEAQMKAEYEKAKGQLAHKEYKARHILVNSKEKADNIIQQLDKGAKFADLATKYSTDPGSKNGGDLGWFSPQQMVPPFAAAVEQLKKGEYTRTPVKTQFGWHVIQLEDTRDVPAPSYDEVKDRIRNMLQQRAVGEYIQSLRTKAKVNIKNQPAAK